MNLRGITIASGIGAALLLIAISVALVQNNHRLLEANADAVEKAYRVNEALDRSYSNLLLLAADIRYYVITGDSGYLNTLESNTTLIRKELEQLQILMQQENIHILMIEKDYFDLVENKLQFDEYVRSTRLDSGFAAAQNLIATGQGRKLLNRILLQRNTLSQAINKELADRENKLYAQIATNEAIYKIGFSISILSLILLSYFLYRKMRVAQALSRKVREKEEQLSVILSSITDGVIATDLQGRINYINPVAEKLTGWERQAAYSKEVGQIYKIKDEYTGAILPDPVKKIISEKVTMPLVNGTVLITRQNEECIINNNGAPIHDANGKVMGAVLVFRNITEKVKAEKKLANAQKRFNTAFFNNPSPMVIASSDNGKIIEANESFLRLMDYSLDEVIGKTSVELNLYTTETRNSMIEKIRRDGRLMDEEVLLNSKSGKLKPVLASVTPVNLAEENCYLINLVDMTGWRETERSYQSIFMNTQEGIYQSTPGGRFIAANPAMAEMFGYASARELIESVTDIGNQIYMNSTFRENMEAQLKESEQIKGLEIQAQKKNKEIIWIRANIHVVNDLDGQMKYYEGTLEDITDKKRAEENLISQHEELKKINHELDHFVYSISHDLRAPLASMLGLLNLCEYEPMSPILQGRMKMMRTSVRRMDGFIRDILDYSRNNRKEVQHMPVPFHGLLDELQKDLAFMNGADRVNFLVEIQQTAPFVSDAVRIETILRNLYSNAIKYQDYSKENPEAKFSIVNDHHTAYIRYKDNGIGIHEKYLERIGEMFFRASEKAQGSGLGLYITRETIQRLGGTLTLTSEFGRYTEIEIALPNRLNQQQ